MSTEHWRIGKHYGIHVYEGDRPVATFHRAEDAMVAVIAHNLVVDRLVPDLPDEQTEAAS